jgi:hypothetical protein
MSCLPGYVWQVRSVTRKASRHGRTQAMNVRYRWLRAPDLNLHRQPARAMIFRKPSPAAISARMACSIDSELSAIPAFYPCCCTLQAPASTRSGTIARSKSANTPIIWNMALPDGVVVSIPCWCR